MAFTLPEAPRKAPDDVIVVTLRQPQGPRALPAAWGGVPAHPEPWLRAMAAELDRLAGASGLSVRFVALQADRDGLAHRAVADRMSQAATLESPNLDELPDRIGRSRRVFSMRYHGMVLAALAGVPAIGMAFSPKINSLAHELGLPTVNVTPGEPFRLDGAAIPDDLSGLAERVSDLRVRADANRIAISELLSG